MALGELTKQLASQAIRNAVNPPPAAAPPNNAATAMLGQLQAMQKALKDDEELVVLVQAGGEIVRAMEFFFPSWHVAVITGLDKDKAVTRVISAIEALQLTCKIAKSATPGAAARLKFVTPKPKSE